MAILAYQPFKLFYSLFALGFELARLPLWLVKYLTSLGRQHPQWSFRQALGVRFLYSFIDHATAVQVSTPLSLKPGKEKERFVVIKAASKDYFKGPLSPTEDVKPTDTGATWYPAPLTAGSNTSSVTVILHVHGGAYVVSTGRDEDLAFGAKQLLANTSATHVLSPQYRLSTLPASKKSNPFPAAIQDCLQTYLYLLNDLKVPASNIIISGDSAGGNAAIAIARYIAEYGSDLGIPAPSAALLWSPWVQIKDCLDRGIVSSNRNYNSDYIPPNFVVWGAQAYAGLKGPSALSSPYIQQKGQPFKSPIPFWVNTGDAEVLHDEDVAWATMMKENGNKVTLDVDSNVPHDIILIGEALGFTKEMEATAKRAGKWLKEVRK